MKKLIIGAFIVLNAITINAQTYRIATYNLRYDNPSDSLDLWKTRYPAISEMVKYYDFDIFGTQEGLLSQLEDLKGNLEGYNYIGIGRDDGEKKGEHSAIFYKTGKFKLLDKGDFWLSAFTKWPNKGWDAACKRICSWGKFEEIATGKQFFMFNVHYDHIGKVAQKESSKLMLKEIRKIAGNVPAILTGDFNVTRDAEAYILLEYSDLLKDARDMAQEKFEPGGTFNAFDLKTKPSECIDHIFITDAFKASRYGILSNTYNGRYPSDHFPVLVELTL